MDSTDSAFFPYTPNKVLPVVFSVLVGSSLALHTWQNFHYRFWRVTFWMFWGGLVFTAGWVLRAIFAQNPSHQALYIAQTCLILGGPPIYSAAEYNVLSRILHYLPMHAPIGPNRVIFFFSYVAALVESLTAAGGAMMARNNGKVERIQRGSLLISIAVILQAVVQLGFASMVGYIHHRVIKANMLTPKIRTVFIMLYGTSGLVIIRCIFRAIEKFSRQQMYKSGVCEGACTGVIENEWYLYAFEAAPMVLYTFWINIIHPGRFLPHDKNHFLDYNRIERIGPVQGRKQIRWMSLLDMGLGATGDAPKDKYWERPEEWPPATKQGWSKNEAHAAEEGSEQFIPMIATPRS